MEFTGFLGNSDLKQRLSAAFRSGKTSHCYLLCGPAGSGKRTLARMMSAALQCTAEVVPCGRCHPCRKVFANTHPDVITVDDADKKTVSVDLIRQLQADAYVRPNEGRHKVYLIPRAQDMTESAQNALLKLIEEPPSYAVFLLIADNADKLLPTVRSRCAELRLEPIPREEALTWLRSHFPDRSASDLATAYLRAGGYLGQAEAMLESMFYAPQTLEFAQAYANKDYFALVRLFCSLESQPREALQPLLLQWRQLLTDAMLIRAGLPGSAEATSISHNRTGVDLTAAVKYLQQAMDACDANIGIGHICGWLTAVLR